MRLRLTATSDIEAQFSVVGSQAPEVLSKAVNWVVKDAWNETRSETTRVFEQPRPITKAAPRYKLSTPSNPVGHVFLNPDGDKGTSPERYLKAQVEGGTRGDRPHERRLRQAGVLPSGYMTIPGNNRQRPRDRFGDLPGSEYVKILSDLQSFRTAGFEANRNPAKRSSRFFSISTPNDPRGLPMGIYRYGQGQGASGGRGGGRAVQYLAFVRVGSYSKRYPFEDIAIGKAEQRLPGAVDRAIRKALRM